MIIGWQIYLWYSQGMKIKPLMWNNNYKLINIIKTKYIQILKNVVKK